MAERFTKKFNFFLPSSFTSAFTSAFIIFLLIIPIILHAQEALAQKEHYSFSENEYELITYLQNNTSPNDVILSANLTWNLWIPAYTTSNIYFPYGAATLASDEEIQERFITTYKLLNYTSQTITSLLHANSVYARLSDPTKQRDTSFESFLPSYIFVDSIYPVNLDGFFKKRIYNGTDVELLIKQYNNTSLQPGALFKYQLDYILLVGEEKDNISFVTGTLTKAGAQTAIVFENEQFILINITSK